MKNTSFRVAMAGAVLALVGFTVWKTTRPPAEGEHLAIADSVQPATINAAPIPSSTAHVPTNPHAARISFAGTDRVVTPNVRGEYARVLIPPSVAVIASVPFPDAAPGESIRVQAEDGGLLEGLAEAGKVTIDAQRFAQFEFRAPAHDGMHRVTLRRGGEQRIVEFWVGAEPPVLVRN